MEFIRIQFLSFFIKYKIVHDIDEHAYTLCTYNQPAAGNTILVFEAKTYEEAMFIRNQFLHFEPYKPFDNFWIATVGHHVYVDNQLLEKDNYEIRTLMVLARTKEIAKEKVLKEAKEYSVPYENGYGQPVSWRFDQILSLEIMDFFSTIHLYQGKPIEVKSKRITKHK